MDIRKIKKLIELIDSTGVQEIEITEGESSVRINRGHQTQEVIKEKIVTPPNSISESKIDRSESIEDSLHTLKSPMIGTMFIAKSPDSEPFVSIGQKVNKGDTLCIVEAMKMFNEIEADKSGIIKSRLVSNGQPVEFGQALFKIDIT